MQFRFKNAALILLAALVILFGGWFAYQQFGVKHPIENNISKLPNVTLQSLSMDSGLTTVQIKLQDVKDFQKTYNDIQQAVTEQGNRDRKVVIKIEDTRNAKLTQLWNRAYFVIAQSIETKQYAAIPAYFDGMVKSRQLSKHDVRMDEHYIYIHLADGKHELYTIIPRGKQAEVGYEG